jgi:predicted RNase H-like HicB family nuclease
VAKKSARPVTLREYVTQVLGNAIYGKGEALDVVVAEAPDLPGCFTQGGGFEQARENLIDAIDVWIMATLQSGDRLPIVNGCQLAITADERGRQRAKADSAPKTRKAWIAKEGKNAKTAKGESFVRGPAPRWPFSPTFKPKREARIKGQATQM